MKDKIKAEMGFKFTAKMLHELVVKVWTYYPVERINHHIMSTSRHVESCIANGGGKYFNFEYSPAYGIFAMQNLLYAGHMRLHAEPVVYKIVSGIRLIGVHCPRAGAIQFPSLVLQVVGLPCAVISLVGSH